NIVWDNVDSQSFTAVQVPTVEGLTPDKTEVASSEVTPDFNGDKTNTVTVTYTADKQTARVVFVDKDNNGVEVANSGDLTGVSKGTIAYSTADTIKALEEKGYVLVTDGFPSNASFDTDSSVDQVFTVVLKHGQEAASRTQNVTQTVTYVVPEGFDKPADSTQTLSFTQTGTKDLVTGNITWDNVDSENFTTVQVPAVEGLTPDKTEVASSEVTPDFNGDKTNTVTVTYTADKQTARVVFVDEDNNGAEVANSGDLTGTSKSTIVYSTADTIKSLEEKGYVLVNDGFTAGTTFDMDAKTDQVCTVTLKHGIKETVATKDATQIIHYQGLDEAVPDQTQVVKDAFKQTTYVDQVTGETVKTDPWTGTAAFTAVQTPVVNGYHADQAQAGGITASPDQPTVETTVTYAKNGSLILVDQNGQQLAGTTQTQYTTDPADPTKVLAVTVPSVDGYEPQGKTVGETITPADPSANTYVVYTQKSTVPSEPVTPSEPEQPTTPTEPETPTTPEQPTTPSEPTQPTTPTTPSTPEVPSKPATPSEPTQPATPVQPTTPATPSTPEVPSKPATPSVPKATAKTVTGQKNKTKLTANQTKLPQTGESEEKSVLLSLMGAALTIGAGLLGAFTKRKKH
ncbi:mucin-binding protein, partial [Lactobacillus sp.]|uniref:mucin-binding protein n=1 Tax=Lactobacillus sp. TaxID=1591 RepID=UPI003EF9F237